MSTLPESLTSALAQRAAGYAAVIDGVLNIRTVSDGQNAAALNALHVLGFRVVPTCRNPECDCMVKLLAKIAPSARVVAIEAEVRDA